MLICSDIQKRWYALEALALGSFVSGPFHQAASMWPCKFQYHFGMILYHELCLGDACQQLKAMTRPLMSWLCSGELRYHWACPPVEVNYTSTSAMSRVRVKIGEVITYKVQRRAADPYLQSLTGIKRAQSCQVYARGIGDSCRSGSLDGGGQCVGRTEPEPAGAAACAAQPLHCPRPQGARRITLPLNRL